MRGALIPFLLLALAAPARAQGDTSEPVKETPAAAAAADPKEESPVIAPPNTEGMPLAQGFAALGGWFKMTLFPSGGPDSKDKPAGAPPAQEVPPPKVVEVFETAAAKAETLPEGERDAVYTDAVVQAATVLEEPPPPGVDPVVYKSARVEMGRFAISAGSDKDRRPFTAALTLSQTVLEDDPDDRDALNNAAGANYGLGRYREAVDAATRVTRRHKDDERAYTTRALAHYQMKDYNQAYEDASLALKLNPKNETAFQISKLAQPRMTTPADLGLDAAARHAAEQVRREYEASLDERGRAETAATSAPARIPGPSERSSDALARQAAGKVKLGDYQGAIADADHVLSRDPGHPDALQARAQAAVFLGDFERAAADAAAALERRPDHADALLTRANALTQLGKSSEALLAADKAVSLRPRDPFAYKARARAKEAAGDLAGMLGDYRQAAKLGPQFDAELQQVAAKYGLSLAPDRALSRGSAASEVLGAADGTAPPKRRGRMLFVLASSVLGGLLIAWGLLHVAMGTARKGAFSGVAGASPETAKALAAAGGLGSGYEIVRTLGQGGMGVVYEALDKALERRVAVKKMRDEIRLDERERGRFLQEARIVAQLHHPNVVEIHTIVAEGDDLYLVFEYVEGRTVDDILARKGRLSVPEAQWVLHGVSKALEYAHAHGVVHRDLKPSNVMIEKEGGTVKVMDFGIARQAKDAMARSTMTGTVAGTPQYMAPEQEEGVVRPESDVFSMGAMLYEMVTGQRPYPAPATTASKVNKRYERASRLQADLPPELEKLIDDCLEPDPERRPRGAAEFRARLGALKGAPAKA